VEVVKALIGRVVIGRAPLRTKGGNGVPRPVRSAAGAGPRARATVVRPEEGPVMRTSGQQGLYLGADLRLGEVADELVHP
jgi:hypothetical protein